MARNCNPKVKFTTYEFNPQVDFRQTIQDGAITPRQIKELSDRGISVSPSNLEREIHGKGDWSLEPIFRRDMDMSKAWEMEQSAKKSVRSALRKQKGDNYIKSLKSAQEN